MDPSLERRAAVHAALGEPVRLAIVEELAVTDRSPSELGAQFGLPTNLLAHHLDVLEQVGLIERFVSTGDRRRRYVRLLHPTGEWTTEHPRPHGRVLFVCTHNSARSQLAAALWQARTGVAANSAGTHPAERVHPGAVAAAHRAGLDLSGAEPRQVRDVAPADLVVTVCDRAHEELRPGTRAWHWSTPDPVEAGTDDAFDHALRQLDARIEAVIATT